MSEIIQDTGRELTIGLRNSRNTDDIRFTTDMVLTLVWKGRQNKAMKEQ